jgi:hypothetical protein
LRARRLALALLPLGCATSAPLLVTPSGADIHPERRPVNCHIEFLRTKSPERPYDEIATLHFVGAVPIGPAEAQERMRVEACRLGAHAVVVSRDYALSMMTGTAIVYRGAIARDAGQPDPVPPPPSGPEPEGWMKRICTRDMDPLAARVRAAAALRDEPEATASTVTYVDADAVVCAAGRATGLYRKVVLSDGRSGYLAESALELGKPTVPAPAPKPAPKKAADDREKPDRLDPRTM